jgi:hypothetical protein
MEGSLVAYKVFSNGSTLPASDINDNLMNQSVIVFSNAAARSAAITSPLEGMLTWLEDVNRYEFYNGSAWAPESSALILLNTTTLSGSSTQINNVFSSLYNDYLILASNVKAAAASFAQLRLSASGTPATTNVYWNTFQYWDSSVINGVGQNETGFKFPQPETTDNNAGQSVITLMNPARTLPTNATFSSLSGNVAQFGSAVHRLSNSYDGLTILTGSTFTSGQVRIYGYRNS